MMYLFLYTKKKVAFDFSIFFTTCPEEVLFVSWSYMELTID